jgi:hypothetical protein
MWQVIAIVAIILASIGWTATVMLAVRGPGGTAEVTDPPDTSFDLGSAEPIVLSHDFPDLEALLPAEAEGVAFERMSWTGDKILTDGGWANSMTAFLGGIDLDQADLQIAQSSDPVLSTGDPTTAVAVLFRAYRVDSVPPTELLDAMVEGWQVDYPDMTVSHITIGDKAVTKGDFGEDQVDSFWYIEGDVVYDVETSDEALAATALASIPASGAPSASASAAPSAASSPDVSPSPS